MERHTEAQVEALKKLREGTYTAEELDAFKEAFAKKKSACILFDKRYNSARILQINLLCELMESIPKAKFLQVDYCSISDKDVIGRCWLVINAGEQEDFSKQIVNALAKRNITQFLVVSSREEKKSCLNAVWDGAGYKLNLSRRVNLVMDGEERLLVIRGHQYEKGRI